MARIHLLVLCPQAGWEQVLQNRLSWEAGALACVVDETLAFETAFMGHEGKCDVEEVLKVFLCCLS